jgi:hypothetical protein
MPFVKNKNTFVPLFFANGICWIWLCLFCSCSPTSLSDLRCEAEGEMKQLTIELKEIYSNEDLEKRAKRVKKRFNQLARLLVATRNFEDDSSFQSLAAEALFVELARLYEIPGMREQIESLQREAVHILDSRR